MSTASPYEMRGRVMSLCVITFVGFYPILGVLGGLVSNNTGVPPLFVVAGVVCLLYLIPLARWAPEIDLPAVPAPHGYTIDTTGAETAFAVEELTAATEAPLAGWALERDD